RGQRQWICGSPHLAAKDGKCMASSIDSQQAGDCRVLGWGKTTGGATAAFPAAPVTLEEAEGCGLYFRFMFAYDPRVSKAGNSIVIAAAIIAAIRLAREEKIEVSSPTRNRPGPF